MRFDEITSIKPKPVKALTPAQARVAALKNSVGAAKSALDSERKRQSVVAAQNSLNKALAPKL